MQINKPAIFRKGGKNKARVLHFWITHKLLVSPLYRHFIQATILES